jgi:hypothetical protein
MTYQDAIKTLPLGAKWSSSFGNPGDGGYAEYHRAGDDRYLIKNGNRMAASRRATGARSGAGARGWRRWPISRKKHAYSNSEKACLLYQRTMGGTEEKACLFWKSEKACLLYQRTVVRIEEKACFFVCGKSMLITGGDQ